jgi:hypothetical protein
LWISEIRHPEITSLWLCFEQEDGGERKKTWTIGLPQLEGLKYEPTENWGIITVRLRSPKIICKNETRSTADVFGEVGCLVAIDISARPIVECSAGLPWRVSWSTLA